MRFLASHSYNPACRTLRLRHQKDIHRHRLSCHRVEPPHRERPVLSTFLSQELKEERRVWQHRPVWSGHRRLEVASPRESKQRLWLLPPLSSAARVVARSGTSSASYVTSDATINRSSSMALVVPRECLHADSVLKAILLTLRQDGSRCGKSVSAHTSPSFRARPTIQCRFPLRAPGPQ